MTKLDNITDEELYKKFREAIKEDFEGRGIEVPDLDDDDLYDAIINIWTINVTLMLRGEVKTFDKYIDVNIFDNYIDEKIADCKKDLLDGTLSDDECEEEIHRLESLKVIYKVAYELAESDDNNDIELDEETISDTLSDCKKDIDNRDEEIELSGEGIPDMDLYALANSKEDGSSDIEMDLGDMTDEEASKILASYKIDDSDEEAEINKLIDDITNDMTDEEASRILDSYKDDDPFATDNTLSVTRGKTPDDAMTAEDCVVAMKSYISGIVFNGSSDMDDTATLLSDIKKLGLKHCEEAVMLNDIINEIEEHLDYLRSVSELLSHMKD